MFTGGCNIHMENMETPYMKLTSTLSTQDYCLEHVDENLTFLALSNKY